MYSVLCLFCVTIPHNVNAHFGENDTRRPVPKKIFAPQGHFLRAIDYGSLSEKEEQKLAGHFQVRSIPTTMILRDNIAVFQQPGLLPEKGLKDVIRQVQELDMDMVRREVAGQQVGNASE